MDDLRIFGDKVLNSMGKVYKFSLVFGLVYCSKRCKRFVCFVLYLKGNPSKKK